MRRNKYNAKKVTIDGIEFDSAKEARRYGDLKMLVRGGAITGLEMQPKFFIIIDDRQVKHANGRRAVYTADFRYYDHKLKDYVVEDVKSKATRTEAYILRKAIVEHIYNIKINEV